mmetsp:Transcript_12935/g.41021  ORF Transcript_12935/g.41021 Transcript_12935/m.41021 type:complete len:97 (+) Transcript_12935:967-1257(+)
MYNCRLDHGSAQNAMIHQGERETDGRGAPQGSGYILEAAMNLAIRSKRSDVNGVLFQCLASLNSLLTNDVTRSDQESSDLVQKPNSSAFQSEIALR